MSARIVHTIASLEEALQPERSAGRVIGLVPTMGALHEGHGRLMDVARAECGGVVTSIFVNPIQFDRPDDYARYPRTLERDTEFCSTRGADLVFAPSGGEMYPQPQRSFVQVERVGDYLCGQFRPGHFRGVATVVLKLLNIVKPDRAYFGEKDAQQVAVVRRMVRDLNVPVEIVEVATVRDADGLALSSRNQHLSVEERRVAPALIRALQRAQRMIAAGATDAGAVKRAAGQEIAEYPRVRIEYLEIVDPDDMQPVATIEGAVRVAGAVWVGSTRLIDNLLCVANRSGR